MTKMAKIDTLFLTKTAQKPILFKAAHIYIAHVRDSPPGGGGGPDNNLIRFVWQTIPFLATNLFKIFMVG